MASASTQKNIEEELKKLAAEFDFFAHITSHDLRDPLRQARIYSDELLAKLSGGDREKLAAINKQVDIVLEKIAILREYSYVANNRSEFTKIDLNKLVSEITGELSEKIKAAGANIKIANLPTIKGNEKHLKKLFAAIIDNSLKFRSPDRKLDIGISVTDENSIWHFVVSDNGIGLDEVYRELVFVLFQRLDSESQNGSFGSGLTFAKKIVENHNGKIWYTSDGESGTEFHFTIAK